MKIRLGKHLVTVKTHKSAQCIHLKDLRSQPAHQGFETPAPPLLLAVAMWGARGLLLVLFAKMSGCNQRDSKEYGMPFNGAFVSASLCLLIDLRPDNARKNVLRRCFFIFTMMDYADVLARDRSSAWNSQVPSPPKNRDSVVATDAHKVCKVLCQECDFYYCGELNQ